MRPTLRQLEYLVAVGNERNFRKAAEAAFVSQPGLSAQIQQLERVLGVKLFERDRRKVLPTAAGETAIEQARSVLTQVDELVDAAGAYGSPLTGTLRLGVIPTIAPYLLPSVIPPIRRRFPDLRLLLREDHTDRLVRSLADGDLDLLLLALEADLVGAEPLALFRDCFVLAVPDTHALAKRKRAREQDLDGRDLLLLEDGH